MPLNTPDPTLRCLRERYGTASRETSALRDLVTAGKNERVLGDALPSPHYPIPESRLPTLPRLHSGQFAFAQDLTDYPMTRLPSTKSSVRCAATLMFGDPILVATPIPAGISPLLLPGHGTMPGHTSGAGGRIQRWPE